MKNSIILGLILCSVHVFAQEDSKDCKAAEPTYINRMPGYYISECRESEFNEVTFAYSPAPSAKTEVLTKAGKYRRIYYWHKSDDSRKISALQIRENYYNAVVKAKGKVIAYNKTLFSFMNDGKEVYLKLNTTNSADERNFNIEIVEVEAMKQDLEINLKEAIDATGKAVLYGILFDVGKSNIKPESEEALKQITGYLSANPSVKVIVVGHTDNTGTFAGNETLSKARAESIRNWLISSGKIAPERLLAAGVGQSCPVSTNDTEEGRKLNRRVEIVKQ
jgi:outer membrane protein OmpA-like peptidoglycan-associated protein